MLETNSWRFFASFWSRRQRPITFFTPRPPPFPGPSRVPGPPLQEIHFGVSSTRIITAAPAKWKIARLLRRSQRGELVLITIAVCDRYAFVAAVRPPHGRKMNSSHADRAPGTFLDQRAEGEARVAVGRTRVQKKMPCLPNSRQRKVHFSGFQCRPS